jgi:hypothetical protein
MKRFIKYLFISLMMVSFYQCGNQDESDANGNKIDTTGDNINRDTLNRPSPTAPPQIDTMRKSNVHSMNRQGQ